MIERKFVIQKLKEKQVQDFVASELVKSGNSRIEIRRTPLGEKIIIYTSRPGLIVGKKGENIKRLTTVLKERFNMTNPEIEVEEIANPHIDASSVADNIAYTLERYGPKRFKFIGYDTLNTIMSQGVLGAEIIISGRGVPGARAKSWRFSAGHLKKSGDVSDSKVQRAATVANLRSGTIGIKVAIMPKGTILPDKVELRDGIKVEMIEEKSKNGNKKK